MLWLLWLLCLPGCDMRATAELPGADGGTERRIGEELDRLRGGLSKTESGYIKTSATPGPQGTTILMAAVEDAYPGSGVWRAVFYDGQSWGTHGQKPLAELVRARGWLAAPPPELIAIVDAALFEGMGGFSEAAVEQAGGGLRLTGKIVSFPAATRAVVVEIPAEGKERVSFP